MRDTKHDTAPLEIVMNSVIGLPQACPIGNIDCISNLYHKLVQGSDKPIQYGACHKNVELLTTSITMILGFLISLS